MKKKLLLILITQIYCHLLFAQLKPIVGDGSSDDPYQLETVDHLLWLSVGDADNSEVDRWSASYILMENIDLTSIQSSNEGEGFIPIGNSTTPFSGVFNGNQKSIENLLINRPSERYQGFFGVINGGQVNDLQIMNVSIKGERFCGALAGKIDNSSNIENIIASGQVDGQRGIGGIIGEINNQSTVSYVSSFVNTSVSEGEKNVGGIAGVFYNKSSIHKSYAVGEVTGTSSVGALVGAGHFSNADKLVTITDSYWDKETTTQISSSGVDDAFGLTTEDFSKVSSFTNWDFENRWDVFLKTSYDENIRPYLKWLHTYSLTLTAQNATYGSVEGGGVFNNGENVTIKAIAYKGAEFLHWQRDGNIYSEESTLTFDIGEDLELEAIFQPISYTITETITPRGSVLEEITEVTYFDTKELKISPKTGYEIEEVFLNDISQGVVSYITLVEVEEDIEITVNYKPYNTTLPQGSGTEEDPYRITTLEELRWVSQGDTINNIGDGTRWGYHYRLMNDLDLSSSSEWNAGQGFLPLGSESKQFKGHFDGNRKALSGVTINRPKERYIGLFGYTNEGNIHHLQLQNLSVTGERYVGGLIGRADQSTQVNDVIVSGNVLGERSVGGVFGELNNSSAATQIISGVHTSVVEGEKNIGGIVGTIYNKASLSDSYAFGLVTGTSGIGGLAGVGHFTSSEDKLVSITDSYWDVETTSQLTSGGSEEGFGLTTSSFSDPLNFENWDFTDVWEVKINVAYSAVSRPYMKWIDEVSLDLFASNGSYGSVEGGGSYSSGTEVTISAIPNEGANFQHWKNGEEVYSTESSLIITVTDNLSLEAVFEPIYHDVIIATSPRGSVSSEDFQMTFFDEVTLDITADRGYEVTDVLLNEVSQGAVLSLTLNGIASSQSIEVIYSSYNTTLPQGSGTEEDPYRITTLEELRWISQGDTINNIGDGTRWSYHYQLMNDLDLSSSSEWNAGQGFLPLGSESKQFKGHFDGNRKVLSGVTINRPKERYIGLFGYTNEGNIHHLQLQNLSVTGERYVGGLIGRADQSTQVNDVIVSGNVLGERSVGGVFGELNNSSTATQIISGVHTSVVEGEKNIGGIVGTIYNKASLSDSYAFGLVTGTSGVGGLAGVGHFTSSEDKLVSITNSYWDVETTSQLTSGGSEEGFGLTTSSFSDPLNFENWDFTDVWEVKTNVAYSAVSRPYMKWIDEVSLDLFASNGTYGSVEGGGSYSSGTEVTISAISKEGANFQHWKNGEEVYSTESILTITVTDNLSLEAVFEPIYHDVIIATSPRGSVSSEDFQMTFFDEVTLDITAGRGYEVTDVLLNEVSQGAVLSLTLNGIASSQSIEVVYSSYNTTLPQGSGTEEDPYRITTLEELRWVSQGDTVSNIGDGTRWGYHYRLMNDLDLSSSSKWNSGQGFLPLGSESKQFKGHFDGNRKVLSGVTINRPKERYIGLFGYTNEGNIHHLQLQNLSVTGERYVGGLIGRADQSTQVNDVIVSGSVLGERSVGGVFGELNNSSTATQIISGVHTSVVEGEKNIGGIVGTIYNKASLSDSYAFGLVTGTSGVGGLAGVGHFTSSEDKLVSITNSYWDVETTSQLTSGGSEEGFGLTTSSFSDPLNFKNWDFTDVWEVKTNVAYSAVSRPYMKWIDEVSLDLFASNGTYGSVEGGGSYSSGTEVTISAISKEGANFQHWKNGEEVYSTESILTITVTDNLSLEAVFEPIYHDVIIATSPRGSVSSEDFQMTFFDEVTLDITAGRGYEVTDVLLNEVSQGAVLSLTLNGIASSQSIEVVYSSYNTTLPQGSGTEEDPYRITTLEELRWVSQGDTVSNIGDGTRWGYHYRLMNDLDLSSSSEWNSGQGFLPLGSESKQFKGHFDGNRKVLSGVTINRPKERYIGLFGYTNEGNIHHLQLQNLSVTGERYVGGLIGRADQSTQVNDVIVSGSVLGERSVGGVFGELNNSSTATQIISGVHTSVVEGEKNIGGIVGTIYNKASLSDSYAFGLVTGTSGVGGLAGVGHFTSSEDKLVSITDSYWDVETTSQLTSGGSEEGFGLTTSSFSNPLNFENWDFADVWEVKTNVAYSAVSRPYMKWIDEVSLDLFASNGTYGSVEGGGSYSSGTEVTISAISKEGANFQHWKNGEEVYSTESSLTITVTDNLSLEAVFEPIYHDVIISTSPRGSVSSENFQMTFFDEVTLDITADRGYEVTDVLLNEVSQGAVLSLTLNGIASSQSIEVVYSSYNTTLPQGSGTEEDPYRITTLEELRWVSQGDTINNIGDGTRWSAHYRLMNDLDLSSSSEWNAGQGFLPLGSESKQFKGHFDGNRKVLSGVTINRPKERYIGLFGYTNEGNIHHLQLQNLSVTGERYVGGLIGRADQSTQVNDVIVSGNVLGERSVGGVFGELNNSSTATQIISGVYTSVVEGEKNIGGIVGTIYNKASLSDSYAFGLVTGTSGVGGLAGVGHFTSSEDKLVSITNSYWDVETTSQLTSGGSEEGFGLTTSSFSDPLNFENWDFTDVWEVKTNVAYSAVSRPYMKWIDEVSLDLFASNGTYGSVEGGGSYSSGTEVTISAISKEGANFQHWKNGEEVYSTESSLTITVTDNLSLEAVFEPIYHDVIIATSPRGSVSSEDFQMTFFDEVTLDITAGRGYEVTDVLINEVSQGAVLSLTLNGIASSQSIEVIYSSYNTTLPQGSGTEEDPYRITTLEELRWVSQGDTINNIGDGTRWSFYYELIENIDASATKDWNTGLGFSPIGTDSKSFKGQFIGNSKVISNLTINRSRQNNVGFIGASNGGKVSLLELENININGLRNVGGLIGKADNGTLVEEVIVSGSVHGERGVGGIFGDLNNASEGHYLISGVSVSVEEGEKNVGGLAGTMYNRSVITTSYAFGSVSGASNTGGLVGIGHFGNEEKLTTILSSYWDTERSGQNTSAGSEETSGLSSALFAETSSFVDWDFTSKWVILQEERYDDILRPYFQWMNEYNVLVINSTPTYGSVEGGGSYAKGTEVTLTATVEEGASFVHWKSGEEVLSEDSKYTFTIESNINVEGVFEPIKYEVIAGISERGIVTPDTVYMTAFESREFIITPNRGYEVDEVWVNNESIGRKPYFTLEGITSNQSIEVTYTATYTEQPEGEGTEESPYLISNIHELRWISEGDSTTKIGDGTRWKSTIELVQNIDASATKDWNAGLGFRPIGNSSKQFKGTFNGNGYKINNLMIQRPKERNIGLIGSASEGAMINNIQLFDINIVGDRYVGAIIGKTDSIFISKVSATGKVHGNRFVGGIAGDLNKESQLSKATSFVDVSVEENEKNVGGLVGGLYNRSSILQSYAVGKVTGSSNVGGLVGTGHKEGTSIESSYWDTETTGQNKSFNQESTFGYSTSMFEKQENFEGWDFENEWDLSIQLQYDSFTRPFFIEQRQRHLFLTANRESWGTLEGNGAYFEGDEVKISATPLGGHFFIEWQLNGEFFSDKESVKVTLGENNVTYKAIFGADEYQIEVIQTENGSISPGTSTVYHNDSIQFMITPDLGYMIDHLLVDGQVIEASSTYTLKDVTQGYTFSAIFKEYEPQVFTIPALAGDNGTISPTVANVVEGEDFTFTITPDPGFEIDNVFVGSESVSVGESNTYTFENVTSNQTISVTFKRSTVTDIELPDNKLNIYPNPFNGRLTIEINNPQNIQIVDLMGKVVYEEHLYKMKNIISLEHLPSGLYILRSDSFKTIKIQKN